jgi:hypothetical protein
MGFILDREIEWDLDYTISPGTRNKKARIYGECDPDEPPCVEDLFVGIVICGKTVDITKLLDPKQVCYFADLCMENALDNALDNAEG